jgi:hypothetical protein
MSDESDDDDDHLSASSVRFETLVCHAYVHVRIEAPNTE